MDSFSNSMINFKIKFVRNLFRPQSLGPETTHVTGCFGYKKLSASLLVIKGLSVVQFLHLMRHSNNTTLGVDENRYW